MTISEYMEELTHEFEDFLIESLDYELKVNEKKIKGEPLTEEEFIFDTYFIKPSTMVNTILKRNSNDK